MAFNITEEEARALGLPGGKRKRRHKYNAKKVQLDGKTFDSEKEANKYLELKLLKRAGKIKEFELQPKFELQPAFKDRNDKLIRAIIYKADFRVTYPNGRVEVIDTKGKATKEYLIKKKLFLYRYPDIIFIEE
jgi:hypothetical protein